MIKIMKYRKQISIAICAYMGQIMFGYSGGWPVSVTAKLEKKSDIILGVTFTEIQLNWIVSIIMLGGLIVLLPLGPLSNKIGRKRTILIGGLLFVISYICLATIKVPYAMMFFRAVQGAASAIALVGSLVYLGEIASTDIRGILLGSMGIFNSLGFLIVNTIGHFVSYEMLNYIGVFLSVVYTVGMLFVPESPVFLIKKGKDEKAKSVLLLLGRKEDAEKLSEIKQYIETTGNSKWTHLFTVKSNRKALVITCVLYILQQFSGIIPLLSYTTYIFKKSGSSIPPFLATIIICLVQLLSGLITPMFIESYGRRFLLMLSTIFSCASMTVLSVYMHLEYYGNPIVEQLKWLPLPVAIIYFLAYSFGFGILPATLAGEMFQLSLRSAGTAVVIFITFIFGFATVYIFGYLVSAVGIHVAFIMFSVSCGLAFIFTLFFVPETKGKSLMEVQKMLEK